MAIKFTDIKSEKTYNIIELLDKKGLVNEVFLLEEEIKHLNTIEDEVESDLYGFRRRSRNVIKLREIIEIFFDFEDLLV